MLPRRTAPAIFHLERAGIGEKWFAFMLMNVYIDYNLSMPNSIKSPVRQVQRGPLAHAIERQLAQRAELFSDQLLDVKTVQAALGGVSYATIRKLISSGRLRTFRIGKHGHHRVRQSVLRELLSSADQQGEVRK